MGENNQDFGTLEQKIVNVDDKIELHMNQTKETLDVHAQRIEYLSQQVTNLRESTTRTEAFVQQIFSILDDIKTNIKWLTQRDENKRTRQSNIWIDLLKGIFLTFLLGGVTYWVNHLH